jgi:MoaA/NifB/PqqE/SkfB family radical SAM enzyme
MKVIHSVNTTDIASNLKSPFYYAEIFDDGSVYNYNSCPNYFKWTSIGNIYQNSINEIWNSSKAQLIRKKVLKNNFSEKNIAIYNANASQTLKELEFVDELSQPNVIMPLPKIVKISHDKECNVKCVTCRKNIICNTAEELKNLDDKIEKYYLPLLQNADSVVLNGIGDTLASRHGRKLIKEIVKTYPKIKFCLHTNGVLCNEKLLTELEIIDKLSIIEMSVHATTKETYNKFVLGGDFDKVIDNLKFLSKLKNDNKINAILLIFVITNFNFREIPEFVEMAKKYSAEVIFWTYSNWGQQTMEQEKEFRVFDREHKEYESFKKILNDNRLNDKIVHLNYLLNKIRLQ